MKLIIALVLGALLRSSYSQILSVKSCPTCEALQQQVDCMKCLSIEEITVNGVLTKKRVTVDARGCRAGDSLAYLAMKPKLAGAAVVSCSVGATKTTLDAKCSNAVSAVYDLPAAATTLGLQIASDNIAGSVDCGAPGSCLTGSVKNTCANGPVTYAATSSGGQALNSGVCNVQLDLATCPIIKRNEGAVCSSDADCPAPAAAQVCAQSKCIKVGTSASGKCALLPKTPLTACRDHRARNKCDVPEFCDGTSLECPPDYVRTVGYFVKSPSHLHLCEVEGYVRQVEVCTATLFGGKTCRKEYQMSGGQGWAGNSLDGISPGSLTLVKDVVNRTGFAYGYELDAATHALTEVKRVVPTCTLDDITRKLSTAPGTLLEDIEAAAFFQCDTRTGHWVREGTKLTFTRSLLNAIFSTLSSVLSKPPSWRPFAVQTNSNVIAGRPTAK